MERLRSSYMRDHWTMGLLAFALLGMPAGANAQDDPIVEAL